MALLILIFIVLPIAELYVIVKVGEAIGVLPTLATAARTNRRSRHHG